MGRHYITPARTADWRLRGRPSARAAPQLPEVVDDEQQSEQDQPEEHDLADEGHARMIALMIARNIAIRSSRMPIERSKNASIAR